jgi:hypothetical protein
MADQIFSDKDDTLVDNVNVPESGIGEEAAGFSAKAQRDKFLGGASTAGEPLPLQLDDDSILSRLQELFAKSETTHSSPRIENELRAFSQEKGFAPKSIYVPFSSSDISPSRAFPDAEITYVDLKTKEVQNLQNEGFKAVEADAATYDPGVVDAVVLPGTGFDKANLQNLVARLSEHIKPGGYLICESSEPLLPILESDSLRETLDLTAAIAGSSEFSNTKTITKDLEDYISKKVADESRANTNLNLNTAAIQAANGEPEQDTSELLRAHMFVFQKK